MPKRSEPNKRADGLKATATKIAQWGPNEPKRAKPQRDWTIAHPTEPRSKNPYIREEVYSREDFARVEKFKEWAKRNPSLGHVANPNCWREPSGCHSRTQQT